MSENPTNHGNNEFEHQDLKPASIYAFLAGLAIVGVIIYYLLWGMYHFLDAYSRTHQPPQNPMVQSAGIDTRVVPPSAITKFPQPRLERNERTEIDDFRLEEEQRLSSYGWVDQEAGVVHIPIERAMQLIEQQGLPTSPRTGTVPPAEGEPATKQPVNTRAPAKQND
jgi:hypothetical protein